MSFFLFVVWSKVEVVDGEGGEARTTIGEGLDIDDLVESLH